MKAIEATNYGSSEVLEVVDRKEPQPGTNQVKIDVKAVGINFADIMQRRGLYPGGPDPPYVPGLEAAGEIEEVGENVDRQEGERVVALVNRGGYAEKVVADARSLFDIPESMSFEEGAGFPLQYLTAHNILHEWGELKAGETVLIHAAAGGVGTAAVQLARIADAKIIGTASTEEKLELASDLGAHHTVNYTEVDFAEEVNRVTDGEGVDMVLDGVGGDVFESSLDCLAHFGRIMVYGVASGQVATPDTTRLLFENKSVIGFHLGTAMRHDAKKVLSSVPELSRLLESRDLEVIVGKVFDLDEAAEAHEYIENRRSMGKVVLKP
ncbi:MAG: NADPH:quinone oxidoreductase family protein [Halobacteria archaeon]|nr:NADPH:quinone oxidoreductase family protein [Halobacteria archaeon]